MFKELKPIPRVGSRALLKNTIEWEIPGEVSASLMLVEKIGYMFFIKIKTPKEHWWSRRYKTKSFSGHNVMGLVSPVSDFLEEYGYYIDASTVELGEKVGDF